MSRWIDSEDVLFVARCAVLLFFAVIALVIVATAAGLAVLIFEGVSGGTG